MFRIVSFISLLVTTGIMKFRIKDANHNRTKCFFREHPVLGTLLCYDSNTQRQTVFLYCVNQPRPVQIQNKRHSILVFVAILAYF